MYTESEVVSGLLCNCSSVAGEGRSAPGGTFFGAAFLSLKKKTKTKKKLIIIRKIKLSTFPRFNNYKKHVALAVG